MAEDALEMGFKPYADICDSLAGANIPFSCDFTHDKTVTFKIEGTRLTTEQLAVITIWGGSLEKDGVVYILSSRADRG